MANALPLWLAAQIDRFDGVVSARMDADCARLEPAPEALLGALTRLRDDDALRFEMLIDLAGLDFAEHGSDEWPTGSASVEGYSRAVAGGGADFGRPAPNGGRFAVAYQLLSLAHNRRLRILARCASDEHPALPSATGIWRSADWYEREAFDLFGIIFDGHPDLRRILTDYGFIGHPLRRDFPLTGHVEVRYDPERGRVVYQPVSIEPRVGVPKVRRAEGA